MAITLDTSYLNRFVTEDDLKQIQPEIKVAVEHVIREDGEGNAFLGWKNLPVEYDKKEFAAIQIAAEKIRKICDVFVVIGIGGSYLGARAAIEFLGGPLYNTLRDGQTPEIYFAGNSISSSALADLLKICEGRDLCINVISKSGTTTEPAVAFRVFRELLEKKYGEEGARERIFVTTDKQKGKLKELADKKGYETFVVPDGIGGRYSVLTAVGLLPIAVSGADLLAMMTGAEKAREAFLNTDTANDCLRYAAIRNILYRRGKVTEILAAYEPSLALMAEWWKQLFGESEGKDNRGIFPASVIFSTDLHSLGQIIQQGQRNIFETVINLKPEKNAIPVPNDPENSDGLNFLLGKTMDEINHIAFTATAMAHTDGDVPNIVLNLDTRNEENFGYMVYFFELACAVSGYTLGVNPFNQPGVEAYKINMYALLGKPGYEEKRKELSARI